MRMTGSRWTALGLLVAAAAAYWQASLLPRWGFDGPGTGFYPQVIAIIAMVLAVVMFFVDNEEPSSSVDDDNAVPRYGHARPEERRVFHIYLLALALLVAGCWWAGFVVTSIVVVITIMRFAERVNWRASLITAFSVAAVGQIGFGWLLNVSLPEKAPDLALRTLMRSAGLL
jgi:FtsH-binding integral membrane protein